LLEYTSCKALLLGYVLIRAINPARVFLLLFLGVSLVNDEDDTLAFNLRSAVLDFFLVGFGPVGVEGRDPVPEEPEEPELKNRAGGLGPPASIAYDAYDARVVRLYPAGTDGLDEDGFIAAAAPLVDTDGFLRRPVLPVPVPVPLVLGRSPTDEAGDHFEHGAR
jgi:hypothetical protein